MYYCISSSGACLENGIEELALKTDDIFVRNFLDVIGYRNNSSIVYLYRALSNNNVVCANKKSISHAYFSKENIKLYKKKKTLYTEEFLSKIKLLSNVLEKEGIDKDSVVITNGMALEAYGIRKAGDIDLVIATSERKKWNSTERIVLSDNIEIKKQDDYFINDLDIVFNNKNYIVVCGFKFLSLNLCFLHSMKLIKKQHNRSDVKLIIKNLL